MDQFDLEQLNEVFDGPEENNYEVVDLMPKAKTPQMFLLKGEGIHNLVVRLMAQKEGGDTLRNLMPNDKNIVVFIMTLNDKGNLGELKGGLGGNPVRALVTIFDTVYKAINPTIVQSIMFRFPAKKMAGQERSVRRILERLLTVRGKNRFVSLPEMANYSSKYSYVVAHKKNLDISDLPGASTVSDRFSKVDTKVGEAFIDTKTGKQVTKGEVVADAIFTSANKVDTKQVIAKSKISRREVMNAQYGTTIAYSSGSAGAVKYAQVTTELPNVEATKDTHVNPTVNAINYRLKTEFRNTYAEFASNSEEIKDHLDPDLVEMPSWQKRLMSRVYKPTEGTHQEKVHHGANIAYRINDILMQTRVENILETAESVIDVIRTSGISDDEVKELSTTFMREYERSINDIMSPILAGYSSENLSKDQREAIKNYTSSGFKNINKYLIGEWRATDSVVSQIEQLDSAFSEHGTKLEEGVKLYRGQSLNGPDLKGAIDRKLYYFKNFVSTSLSPIIFAGGFANVKDEMIEPTTDTALGTSDEAMSTVANGIFNTSIGLIISGADKVKVIIPGVESGYPQECEVILPRGTTVRFDRVKNNSNSNSFMVYATVVEPSKLDESETIYDGDALLETGELVPLNKFSLIETSEHINLAKETLRQDAIDDILVNIISVNSLPEKFII